MFRQGPLPPVPPEQAAVGISETAVLRSRGRVRGVAALLGPAFVAAVAYIDPGNFATNITAGATLGYSLVWVVVAANAVAVLVQYQSAKLGVVTGHDLPELCRKHYPKTVSRGLWVQAEIVAMATDLAEFVGAALGLNLLFGIPLLPAGIITGIIAFVVLALDRRGHRRFEIAITALLGLVLLGFAYDLVMVGADPVGIASGLQPQFVDSSAVLLAAGIVGATVMPHVVYLHSALTKDRVRTRDDNERRELLRFQRLDVALALGVAGTINLTMMVVAVSLFSNGASVGDDPIAAAHSELGRTAGGLAALAFAVALLSSGLSSSSVGTFAGQVVMQGFIHQRIPLVVRRTVTMLPALVVLASGVSITDALVFSQVLLSIGIPFALVPLLLLARRKDVMGALANRGGTTFAMALSATVITTLNVVLLRELLFT